MKPAVKNEQIFIDPVCLKVVTSYKKNSSVTHRFRTYYFCTQACRNAFELNPDKYLEMKIPKVKDLWILYLNRLKKVAEHKIF